MARRIVSAIGLAVFLIGLGMACLAGYFAHNMTNQDRALDQEFEALQGWTVIGIAVASIGFGGVAYGFASEDPSSNERRMPMTATVVGAVVATFGLGSAFWAGLATLHMKRLAEENESSYETLQLWSIVGFWIGFVALAAMIYGLSSSTDPHPRRRLKV